jgi:DNA-directed RNA polymerase subunit K/omega
MTHTFEIVEQSTLSVPEHQGPIYLTRFERAALIGMRAKQLEKTGRAFIQTDLTDVIQIAEAELKAGALDKFTVRRRLPGGMTEEYSVNQLKLRENI